MIILPVVSLDQAKILKALGYNEPCECYFRKLGPTEEYVFHKLDISLFTNSQLEGGQQEYYTAPYISQLNRSQLESIELKTYHYTVSSNNIWTSFDNGKVIAVNPDEAHRLALKELNENFAAANEALKHCDNTLGFTLDFAPHSIEISEKEIE